MRGYALVLKQIATVSDEAQKHLLANNLMPAGTCAIAIEELANELHKIIDQLIYEDGMKTGRVNRR